jgi:predicted nucleic acid-binding protein
LTVVVDASAILAWLFPDEVSVDVERVVLQNEDAWAPFLIWAEVRNGLIVAERRGRIGVGTSEGYAEQFDEIGLALDTTPNSNMVLALCRNHRLTAYDALYLELALRKKASLVTGDAKLAEAARQSGVTVLEG